MTRLFLLLCLFLFACPAREEGPSRTDVRPRPEPVVSSSSVAVEYRVSFEERKANYVNVEGVFPARGREALVIMMPVWTPGSYLVREFIQHVVGLEARSSRGPLEVRKVRKNRFRITLDDSEHVAVRYRLYARRSNVRENFVDADLAVLNGAPTFFADVAHLDVPYRVTLSLPEEWKEAVSGMPEEEGTFVARDYDTLVDSPIVAGNPAIHRFEVEGVEHLLVNSGEGGVWDGPRSAADTEKITRAIIDFWGLVPYRRYVFLNVINEARGGLEHRNSTLMMTSRWKTKDDDEYRGWLGLVSHEFFHTWNGKRLRPRELGPFDYENEVYTDDLWIVEGLTSYYDDLFLARTRLATEKQYLEALSKHIARLETASGKDHVSLAEASYDAWVEFYRWDENSNNTSISYYTKGALVGFLLDAEIRRITDEDRSLDDVMRQAYAEFSGAEGYRTEDFYAVAEHFAGPSIRPKLERMVETTAPLDYGPALEFYGLELEPDEKEDQAYLGVHTTNRVVTEVIEGTAAHAAGVNVGDELIALDDYRIEDLANHVDRYEPGRKVRLLVSRRGRLTELDVKLGLKPKKTWKLRPKKLRSATQIRRFQRLLGAP